MRPQEYQGLTIPGTAAPQCGNSSEVTKVNRSREQPPRGWHSRGYLPHFDTEYPAGNFSARNRLRQHVTEHPAGGSRRTA
ncbi:MAG: hypothetical protein NTV33_07475 [Coprothermobacterota bacterium]|nr:hypothetical protein [Coprothermobacterota bacterium]